MEWWIWLIIVLVIILFLIILRYRNMDESSGGIEGSLNLIKKGFDKCCAKIGGSRL